MSAGASTLAGLVAAAVAEYLQAEGFQFCDEDLAGMKDVAHGVLGVAAALSVTETLRDRFAMSCVAAAARTALTDDAIAEVAYGFADAMLAARQKAQVRHE